MKILQNLFSRKNKAGFVDEKEMMSHTRAILEISEKALLRIFDNHKQELLDKDRNYIIESICGTTGHGPLTEQQKAIHNQVSSAINGIYDLLRIDVLPQEQQQTILFIVRYMIVMKIMFMIELLKNKMNGKPDHQTSSMESLEEMKVLGHA